MSLPENEATASSTFISQPWNSRFRMSYGSSPSTGHGSSRIVADNRSEPRDLKDPPWLRGK